MYIIVYMKTKSFTPKESQAIKEIRNAIMHYGRIPPMRDLMTTLGYKSPRSISQLFESLTRKGVLRKKGDGAMQFIGTTTDETIHAQTVDVPVVGAVACGMPLLAEENIQATMPVSIQLAKPPYKYFMLVAKGDSMNEVKINDGDTLLIRQQSTAENGDYVVALIDDSATVKEFHRAGKTIILKPRSTNPKHQPIILTNNFEVQGIVMVIIPRI